MAVTLVMAVVTVGCTDIEDSIGVELTPDGSIMQIGQIEFAGGVASNGEKILSTRLFKSDRINAATQTTAAMGVQVTEEFGERRSGFFSQYTPVYALDEDDVFGYEPFLDSVVFMIAVNSFSGDTTAICTYEAYEVLDDSFLINSPDTIYNVDFDIFATGALGEEPLFEFVYPDPDNDVYVSTTSYVMGINMTQGLYDLVDRWMLKDDDLSISMYNGDYEEFVDTFKGIYIYPKASHVADGEGATYSITISSSGLGFYGRSLYEEDPRIVKDTISMSYYFRDSSVDEVGGVSIQTTAHDYTNGGFDYANVKRDGNSSVPTTNTIRVAGIDGVVTELSFESSFFEDLEQVLEEAGDSFANLMINTAYMKINTFLAEGDEVYTQGDTGSFTPDEIDEMNLYPTRLALYDTYSTYLDDYRYYELEGIPDYNYYAELYYSTSLTFGGYLNRNTGRYEMHIPLKVQDMWNNYLEAKEDAGGDNSAIDWEGADWNKMYLAPVADDLFTPTYIELQGEAGADGVEGTEVTAPISLNITYTLLKQ